MNTLVYALPEAGSQQTSLSKQSQKTVFLCPSVLDGLLDPGIEAFLFLAGDIAGDSLCHQNGIPPVAVLKKLLKGIFSSGELELSQKRLASMKDHLEPAEVTAGTTGYSKCPVATQKIERCSLLDQRCLSSSAPVQSH